LNVGTYNAGTTTTGGTNVVYYRSYTVALDPSATGLKVITYTVAWSGNRAWQASAGATDCSISPLPANCHAVSLISRKADENLS
jgi:hypothetical protein